MTVGQALARATRRLIAAGIDGAAGDARVLLAHVLGVPRSRLLLQLPEPMDEAAEEAFEALVAARAQRHPVSHLVGRRAFYGRDFRVTPDVLDPRPETEILVAAALEAPFTTVLDLGTGSGAILLTLLAEREGAQGLGTDNSAAALAVAEGNAAALGVTGRARFAQADWWQGVEGRFDLVVSNPPYIAADEMPGLSPEVLREPRQALTDEGDGLSAYHAIAAGAVDHLAPGGRLLVEIGPTQAEDVSRLFVAQGLAVTGVRCDLDERNRVVCASTHDFQ